MLRRILAADLGNTTVTFGRFVRGQVKEVRSMSTLDLSTDAILDLLSDWNDLEYGVYCSVVPHLRSELERALYQLTGRTPLELVYGDQIPFRIHYANPVQLGTDRLAHAFYVRRTVKQNAVVIDIGTAATVDFILGTGEFLGGAILPGPETALEALARRARQLQRFQWQRLEGFVGHSPEEAMEIGLLRGLEGALLYLVEQGERELGLRFPVRLVTGGLADLIHLPGFQPLPFLTLHGLKDYLEEYTETYRVPE